jgi:hypothetical protein
VRDSLTHKPKKACRGVAWLTDAGTSWPDLTKFFFLHYFPLSFPAEQDTYTKQTEEWKAKQAAELEAKSTELQALTAERERQRAALEAYRARYDKDLAELAEAEVSCCGTAGNHIADGSGARAFHLSALLSSVFFRPPKKPSALQQKLPRPRRSAARLLQQPSRLFWARCST